MTNTAETDWFITMSDDAAGMLLQSKEAELREYASDLLKLLPANYKDIVSAPQGNETYTLDGDDLASLVWNILAIACNLGLDAGLENR